MRNAHCRTWNMARKLKITENENNTSQVVKLREIFKNMKNKKCTLIGPGIWPKN